MKKMICLVLLLFLSVSLIGCTTTEIVADEIKEDEEAAPKETILLAAAASLKKGIDGELIPMFQEKYQNITVDATYDSSGKLQTQIEEGADVDVFMSAAMKQMEDLNEKGIIRAGTIVELLENKIVLILSKDSHLGISSFEDILEAETIAIGDPESVPAGQYAKETFENLGLWEGVLAKSSLGTNVTEVLNWVAEGSADAGVVYATDAVSNDHVEVVAEAPVGSVSKVIYPIGIVDTTTKLESAKIFTDFLQSPEAISVFEEYGFTANN